MKNLEKLEKNAEISLIIDFETPALNYRRLKGGGFGQSVARACGLKANKNLNIIDATAGLGEDGFLLASLGANVFLIERHPVVANALERAIDKSLDSADLALREIALRMKVYPGSAFDWIPKLADFFNKNNLIMDVIYLDPMFPVRKKTALVKQEMRVLKTLVGEDLDADELLALARKFAKKVVVKRPKNAPYLGGVMTKDQIVGARNRFDLYKGV